ncbi:Gfo/Idh/MocA family oxidoreductase [Ruegeria sp. R13_0]|uniref:Gfo/Idh/MocA family protein n=1 Tax=Ruegeria sp. R13_0 TaxID=2821099 RepID=UPI001ADAC875|nr:Gfo/Idh/MocA family oxidoreductase [Ruegeria sp. R13_0]
MIDLAVFGTGRIGQVHTKNLAALPGVRVKYLVDPIASPAQDDLIRRTGAAIVEPDEVFADRNVAGVVIASSTDSHAKLLLDGVAAQKAIFCEKPISLDFSTVTKVAAAAEASALPVMLGFQRRYDPNFRAVRDRIADGTAGRLEQLVMHTRDPGPPSIAYVKVSGGMLRDQAIHDFDQARFMTAEEITSIYAVGNCQVDPEIGAAGDIDSLLVTMTIASGRMVQMSNNRRGPLGYDQRLEAHCANEVLFIDNRPQNDIRIAAASGLLSAPPMDYFIARFEIAYRAEMLAFVDMIRNGTKPLANVRDGLEAQRLAEAALISINTGHPVKLTPDWQP